MKRLVVLLVLALGLSGVVGYLLHRPDPLVPVKPQPVIKQDKVVVTKSVPTSVATQPATYHVGDSQAGVSLVAVYRTSYQDRMGAQPKTIEVVVFALSGAQDLPKHAELLLADNSYVLPDTPLTSPELPNCPTDACIAFINPGLTIKAFRYNDLEWYL